MKKLLASALAVLMAGAMLTGCGDSDSSSEKKDTTTTTKAAEAEESVEESKEEEATTTTAAEPEPESEEEPEPAEDVPVFDPDATESVIVVEDPDTGPWANPMGEAYIDYHTLPRDTDLTFTVQVKLSDTFLEMMEADPDGSIGLIKGDEQIGFAPSKANGWEHFCSKEGFLEADFPIGAKLKTMDGYTDGTYMLKQKTDKDGNPKTDKDGNPSFEEDVYLVEDDTKLAELYCKPDGFIKWNDSWKEWGAEPKTATFTITAAAVNEILDEIEALPEEDRWGGILFQASGNFELQQITINYGNILTSTQYATWLENADEGAVWGE